MLKVNEKKQLLMHEDKLHIKIDKNKSHFMQLCFLTSFFLILGILQFSFFSTISVKLDIFRNKTWHLRGEKARLN